MPHAGDEQKRQQKKFHFSLLKSRHNPHQKRRHLLHILITSHDIKIFTSSDAFLSQFNELRLVKENAACNY